MVTGSGPVEGKVGLCDGFIIHLASAVQFANEALLPAEAGGRLLAGSIFCKERDVHMLEQAQVHQTAHSAPWCSA